MRYQSSLSMFYWNSAISIPSVSTTYNRLVISVSYSKFSLSYGCNPSISICNNLPYYYFWFLYLAATFLRSSNSLSHS